jgi:hypothetical protein
LVALSIEPAGANCAFFGTRVQAGQDTSGDQVLQPAEVTTTSYVCGATPRSYTLGGTLIGLPEGSQITLSNNGTDSFTLSSEGSFSFPGEVLGGASYAVTIDNARCTVQQGTGKIRTASQLNVRVQCAPRLLFAGGIFSNSSLFSQGLRSYTAAF